MKIENLKFQMKTFRAAPQNAGLFYSVSTRGGGQGEVTDSATN